MKGIKLQFMIFKELQTSYTWRTQLDQAEKRKETKEKLKAVYKQNVHYYKKCNNAIEYESSS